MRYMNEVEIERLYHHLIKQRAEDIARKESDILEKEFGEIRDSGYSWGQHERGEFMNEDEEEEGIHSRRHDKTLLNQDYNRGMLEDSDYLSMEGDEEFLSRRGGRKLWSMIVQGVKIVFPDNSGNLGAADEPGCTQFNETDST